MPRLMRYGPLLFAAACEFVLQGTEIVFAVREELKRKKEKEIAVPTKEVCAEKPLAT